MAKDNKLSDEMRTSIEADMAEIDGPPAESEDTACPCNGTGLVSGELCTVCHGHGSKEAYKRQQQADEIAKHLAEG